VAEGLETEYPADLRHLASFTTGDAGELREKLRALLELPTERRLELGLAARRAAVTRWSWSGVAERLLEPLR
jgi:glycosyltransferase involved in cell wall biosynthesis